jgi:hypothetical protein
MPKTDYANNAGFFAKTCNLARSVDIFFAIFRFIHNKNRPSINQRLSKTRQPRALHARIGVHPAGWPQKNAPTARRWAFSLSGNREFYRYQGNRRKKKRRPGF